MPKPLRPNILQIRVELGGQVYEGDLASEARIDPDPVGLNQALAEQPGRFAWWATLEVLARTLEEDLQRQLSAKHAELYSFYEASLAATDQEGKRARPTVEKIKSSVLRHAQYQELQARLAAASEQLGLLTVARQTMQMRKDSLLAVASNLRAERDAHLHDQLKDTRERLRAARGSEAARRGTIG